MNEYNIESGGNADQQLVSTRISCRVESAGSVYVAGTFNDWEPEEIPLGWTPEEIPLRGEDQGLWTVELELPPGEHEFKFIVDGEWRILRDCEGPHILAECIFREDGTEAHMLSIQAS